MTYLTLGALAWAVSTHGGTSLRDILLVIGMLLVAMIVGRAWPRRNLAIWVALTALLGWLIIDGPIRSGLSLEAVRVPLLVVAATIAVVVVRHMDASQREVLVTGIIVLGLLQAVIALGQLVVSTLSTGPSRADALLGSPDALGMLLVATSILTAREINRRNGRLTVVALLVQAMAVLATGSRAAIVAGSILAIAFAATRLAWRGRLLVVAAVGIGSSVAAWRTFTEPQDRPLIWLQAVQMIAARPLIGAGPGAVVYAPAVVGAPITTHAHNEPLQWGVEYGLVGVGLALIVLVMAVRARGGTHIRPDRWLQAAAAVLIVAGLTDFTLRITAMTLVVAAIVALALSDPNPAPHAKSDAWPVPIAGRWPTRRTAASGAAPAPGGARPCR